MNFYNESQDADIINLMPAYLLSFSNEGFITRINDSLLSDLGYGRKEIVGTKKIVDILNVGSRIFFQTHFYPLIKLQKQASEIFVSFEAKDKTLLPVLLNAVLVGEEKQFEVHAAGLKISRRNLFETELIESKRLAEKALSENSLLLQAKKQLQQNQFSLELQLKKLSQKYRELWQINEVISHDFQEPLRKVIIFGDKLAADLELPKPAHAMHYLNKIVSSSAKIRMLISAMQQYLAFGNSRVQLTRVNLTEAFRTAETQVGFGNIHNAALTLAGLPEIEADKELMILMFKHLLENSIRFQDTEKSNLEVQVSFDVVTQNVYEETADRYQYEDFLRLHYADNGMGFDDTGASKIFELFRKAHHEKEGMGVGLTYCAKIAELHQGSISAQSLPGRGANFFIMLPLKQVQQDGSYK